jgi:hypothetical protein
MKCRMALLPKQGQLYRHQNYKKRLNTFTESIRMVDDDAGYCLHRRFQTFLEPRL